MLIRVAELVSRDDVALYRVLRTCVVPRVCASFRGRTAGNIATVHGRRDQYRPRLRGLWPKAGEKYLVIYAHGMICNSVCEIRDCCSNLLTKGEPPRILCQINKVPFAGYPDRRAQNVHHRDTTSPCRGNCRRSIKIQHLQYCIPGLWTGRV